MPWQERTRVDLRKEFLQFAVKEGVNFSALCRRFQMSRKAGYKWLKRFKAGEGLEDRSRRPHSSPARTDPNIEARVTDVRRKHRAWGGRKIQKVLKDKGLDAPASSTITDILKRQGLIDPAQSEKHRAYKRFEHAAPNELWQMDFKGHFETGGGRCHALTTLDDHSRYALGLFACDNECTFTVRNCLIRIFRRYGLPRAILCDNGPPWGSVGAGEAYTELAVWLMRVGVRVLHGRPYHPQTQGKEERFHRTLTEEVLWQRFDTLPQCQKRFDAWRSEYNWERPHHALKLEVPGSRYQPSAQAYPEALRNPEYGAGVEVRTVGANGVISLWGRRWKVGKAFRGQSVAVEPTLEDGKYRVQFYNHEVKILDRTAAQ